MDEYRPQDPYMLYKMCHRKWGEKAQLIMLMEECAELIQVVAKLANDRGVTRASLIDEIADVQIMTEQIMSIYSMEREVERQRRRKLQRLMDRVRGKQEATHEAD